MTEQIPFQYALTDNDFVNICAGRGTDKFEFSKPKLAQLFAEKRQKTQINDLADLSFAMKESKECYKQTLSSTSPSYRLYMKNIQYLQEQKKNLAYQIENAEQLQMKEKINYLHEQIHKLDRNFRKKKISASDIIDLQPKSKQNYYRDMKVSLLNSLNRKKVMKENLYNENYENDQKSIFEPIIPNRQNSTQITIESAKDYKFPNVRKPKNPMHNYSSDQTNKKINNLPTQESFKSEAINTFISKITTRRTNPNTLRKLEKQSRLVSENNQISNFETKQNTEQNDQKISKKYKKISPENAAVSIKVWLANLSQKASGLIERCQFQKEDNKQFGLTWKDNSKEFIKILEQYDCFLDLIKEQGLGRDDNFQKVMDYHFANLIQNFKYEKADFCKFKQEYYKHKWAQLQLYFDVDNEQRRKFLESKRKRQISLI